MPPWRAAAAQAYHTADHAADARSARRSGHARRMPAARARQRLECEFSACSLRWIRHTTATPTAGTAPPPSRDRVLPGVHQPAAIAFPLPGRAKIRVAISGNGDANGGKL
jgi:hypothetical protein